MSAHRGVVSIGLAGGLGPEAIGRLAPAIERAGFHALWVNDTPDGDSLAALAAAATVTEHLTLATGVIPLDRRPASEIARALQGIPEARLLLGIGSGSARHGALDLMRDGIRTLRDHTAARIVVGALGPRMRRIAVEDGDGILLNWLTPDAASDQAGELHGIAPRTRVALYARTALDAGARGRLETEASFYGRVPSYAANFARLGFGPLDTVLPPSCATLRDGVEAYTAGVDELVLRAITASDDLEAYEAFISEAAAQLA